MSIKPPNKFVGKIFNFINNIQSRSYAYIYILLIFVFAIVYSLLPNNFYHSTVQYEDSLDSDAASILKSIQNHVFDHQKEIDINNRIKVNDNVFIDGNELLVHSLKYEENQNNEVSFKIRLTIYCNKEHGLGCTRMSQKFKFSLSNKLGMLDTNSSEMIFYFTIIPEGAIFDESIVGYKSNDIYKTLFPEKHINGTSSDEMLIMTMSQTVLNKIMNFKNAVHGFPSNVSNNFARMFYLSTVTITTVGYGDIVPITTLARILISLEAILGILISGLFLNSLANKIKKGSGA